MKKLETNRLEKYSALRKQIDYENRKFSNTLKYKRSSSNRNKLFVSMCVSLTCLLISMCTMVGSSYAWFTDSISNTGNTIAAGELSVDLLMSEKVSDDPLKYEYNSISNKKSSIFKSADAAYDSNATLWEPGATHLAYLAVKNTGDLSLKYQIVLNITDGGLAEYLDIAYVNDIQQGDTNYSSWNDFKDDSNKLSTLMDENGVVIAAPNGKLKANETDYFVLAVHMNEDATIGAMNKAIGFDVTVQATQASEDTDGFGTSTYDDGATFSTLDNSVKTIVDESTFNSVMNSSSKGKLGFGLMLKNFEITKNFELDLDGRNISADVSDKTKITSIFVVPNGVTLTIKNTSEDYSNILSLDETSVTGVPLKSGEGSVCVEEGKYAFDVTSYVDTNNFTITDDGGGNYTVNKKS